jgi:glutamine synthetase
MFVGEELEAILNAIISGSDYTDVKKTMMSIGASVLPPIPKDTTDRNRTSPFAFTGNKFEFRMLGSSNSISCANIMLNSAVAESLRIYADRLEKAEDFEATLNSMIKKTIKDHKRILFNGNGYDDAWIAEATEKRGLLNLRTTPDAIPHILDEKNVKMLTSHNVFTNAELHSRCEITLENYSKTVIIEANTMVDMARKEILPAVERYASDVAAAAAAKKALNPDIACGYERTLVGKLSVLTDQIAMKADDLEAAVRKLGDISDVVEESYAIRDTVLAKMGELRAVADEAETVTAESYWPFPNYGDLLFGVK